MVMQGASFCIQHLVEYFIKIKSEGTPELQQSMIQLLDRIHQQVLIYSVVRTILYIYYI
jgi:hypothetical protein